MEPRARRDAFVLAGLVIVLGVLLWWNLSGENEPTSQSGAAKPTSARAQKHAAGTEPVEDVELHALKQPLPDPGRTERNPFRFKPKVAPPPPPPESGGAAGGQEAGGPAVPQGPPPTPPIPLKFIGVVEQTTQHQKVAALSDGRFTYYGHEGDIIDGRYRIVRIGVESIEMVYVDGRGPQTIRLSGS